MAVGVMPNLLNDTVAGSLKRRAFGVEMAQARARAKCDGTLCMYLDHFCADNLNGQVPHLEPKYTGTKEEVLYRLLRRRVHEGLLVLPVQLGSNHHEFAGP